MPPTVTPTPMRDVVTVPGTAELEFTVGGMPGNRKLDIVVLYTVMDGAAVRIASGASQMRTIGPRPTVVRQRLGFERTDGPTPGAFRVKAAVIEDGKPLAEGTWSLQVQSSATQQVMKAMAKVAPDAPYVPLPDDDEIAALAERADRAASRKRAAKKSAGKQAAGKKTTAKKAAGKKTAAKKSATTKAGAKKSATKKAGAKKGAAKKAGARKTTAKKAATKRPAAKKKSAAKKRR